MLRIPEVLISNLVPVIVFSTFLCLKKTEESNVIHSLELVDGEFNYCNSVMLPPSSGLNAIF